jgi:excisionase family DNA binding protein
MTATMAPRLAYIPGGANTERDVAPLFDAKDAARLLGVPPSWLLAQARARRIPHHRLGHYVRFSAAELRQWLQNTRIDVSPQITRGRPANSARR